MSLIEKALRQAEKDKRAENTFQPSKGFCFSEADNALSKKHFIFAFIVLSVVSISVAICLFYYGGLTADSMETPVFPESDSVRPNKQAIKTDFHKQGNDSFIAKQVSIPFNKTSVPFSQGTQSQPVSHELTCLKEKQLSLIKPEETPQNVIPESGIIIAEKKDPVFVPSDKPLLQEKDNHKAKQKSAGFVTSSYITPESLNNAGLLYLEKGNYKQARFFFEEALKFNLYNEKALNNIGLSFYLEGKTQKAIDSYKDALRINPENIETFANLGIVFKKSGQYQLAENMFKKALSLNPDHPEVIYNYALLLEELNKKKISRFYFEKFLRVAPESLKEHTEKVKNHLNISSADME
jgi:tetratricopeptide (TPR) repeat protein